MLNIIKYFFVIMLFCFGLANNLVFADSEEVKNVDQSSTNYQKAKELLPGEEVVTPTGKKIKVWSTKGPVEVSKAPEPFSDPKKTNLPGDTHILINEESFKQTPTPTPIR